MARKQSRIPMVISPKTMDDFKLIKGIGPALADRLHEAGIHTYNQMASLSSTELAARIIGLSAKQIARKDLISQARKLASKKERSKPSKNKMKMPTVRQHYANFTIVFLLDEKNVTRRTHVVHVQSGDADTWAGWETEQLIDFLARHTHVRIPVEKLTSQGIKGSRKEVSQNVTGESSSMLIRTSKSVPPSDDVAESALTVTEITDSASPSPTVIDLAGTLRVSELKVILFESDTPIFSLRQGQPYILRITLDLSKVVASSTAHLVYKATIIVKQLGGPSRHVSESSSNLKLSDSMTLDIVGTSLPPGLYRLDVFVRLTSNETAPYLTTFLKGDLLQVY